MDEQILINSSKNNHAKSLVQAAADYEIVSTYTTNFLEKDKEELVNSNLKA